MAQHTGILTVDGDAPGLNAAIRGFGKAAIQQHGWELVGLRDGMRSLTESRFTELDLAASSGVPATGGIMLGANWDKAYWMMVNDEPRDMVPAIMDNCERDGIDALVRLGGGRIAENAKRLMDAGFNVIHPPKTIDNGIVHTDSSFGSATALETATQAVDRLHSMAHPHHRITLTEVMGHRAGRLALGMGIAGGVDVILLSGIPHLVDAITSKIERRRSRRSSFSVMAVAEGILSVTDHVELEHARVLVKDASNPERKVMAKWGIKRLEVSRCASAFTLAGQLESPIGLEARASVLGYVQRDGSSYGADHLLGTRLGVARANAIAESHCGVTVADRGQSTELAPLKDVAGRTRLVPADHEWIQVAHTVGMALGD